MMARYQMGPDVQKFLMVSDAGDNMVAEIVVKLFIIVQWTMSIFCLSRTMTFQHCLTTVPDLCIKPLVCHSPALCSSNLDLYVKKI